MTKQQIEILEMSITAFVRNEIKQEDIKTRLINVFLRDRVSKVYELWSVTPRGYCYCHPLRLHRDLGLKCEKVFEEALWKYGLSFSVNIFSESIIDSHRANMQIVMDYNDFVRFIDELPDRIIERIQAIAQQPKEVGSKEWLTPKEVAALFGVTPKTLHVWHKTGFLPRYRIGGVVRYKSEDVEQAKLIKCK